MGFRDFKGSNDFSLCFYKLFFAVEIPPFSNTNYKSSYTISPTVRTVVSYSILEDLMSLDFCR